MTEFSIMNRMKLTKKAIMLVFCILLLGCLFYYIYNLNRPVRFDKVVQMYNEFLNGNRHVGGIDIYYYITPTDEPDKRYTTDYIILDSTGDGIPELHLRTAREYTIFSYVDDEIVIIQSFFSSPWLYNVTKNGAIIYRTDTGTTLGNYYWYFEMDLYGNLLNEVTFEWTDINENFICDENDVFLFDHQISTKEEWYDQTRKYLFIDEEGRDQIRDLMEWNRY